MGISNLGFQLVYAQLGAHEETVCERFFLPLPGEPLRSLESGRPLSDFSLLFFSISFEHDYLNLVRILAVAGISAYSAQRGAVIEPGSPLVACGGVATFLNPEPLAPFIDLFLLGEAEGILTPLLEELVGVEKRHRSEFLRLLAERVPGAYVPSFYIPGYDGLNRFTGYDRQPFAPERIKKVVHKDGTVAAHSELLTPEAEFSDLYLTELGRGCSRGCRFCAAGFIYRPPRLWGSEAVLQGLEQRPQGVDRIGLLGMEMAGDESLNRISRYLMDSGCALSFSSLRADRISGTLGELLGSSGLKSVAIAPDGASERLRRVINKGLDDHDLLTAAETLARAGLYRLKLYLMIGLPTETDEDIDELIEMIRRIKERISPIGRKRGRLLEISLSVNSFTPKPWTPFQYHPFGISERLAPGELRPAAEAVANVEKRLQFLRNAIKKESNVQITCDKPARELFQAVLSRGDRRLAPVLYDMVMSQTNWKQALKKNGLCPEQFAVRGYGPDEPLPWEIVDHGISPGYLWQEYERAFMEKTTKPCDTRICKRCGVCP
ncbi:MAG: radical SAM protein [Thermodesulfobacteriota bacterium]